MWLTSEVGIPTAVDLIGTMDLIGKMVVERDGRSRFRLRKESRVWRL